MMTGIRRNACLLAALLLSVSCSLVHQSTDLAEQVRTAQTPAERSVAAAGYRQEAERLRAEALRHQHLAESQSGLTAVHCRNFSSHLMRAATEAEALADGLEKEGPP